MKWLSKLTERLKRPRDEDNDRNWREMMTHWNEAEKTLVYGPTPATLTDLEEKS